MNCPAIATHPAVGGPEHIGVVGNPWRSRGRLIVEQAPAAFVAAGKLALSVDTKSLVGDFKNGGRHRTPRASRSRFGCTASSSPNSERPTSATLLAASAQHPVAASSGATARRLLPSRVGRAASHGSLCRAPVARSTPVGQRGPDERPEHARYAELASSPARRRPSCSDLQR